MICKYPPEVSRAYYGHQITTIIKQQAVASEQILLTLKQISAGVENFSSATEHISQVSENLKGIASALSTKKRAGKKKPSPEAEAKA